VPAYDELASVYEWLVPDEMLEPDGAVAAFAPVVAELPAGARVLDCAAGTGQLAVGLALGGFEVTATDASAGMVARARALAADHGAELHVERCAWEELPERGWGGAFDAVFCVGNSLAHAEGRGGRRAALAAMAGVVRRGGLLAVTSRNWERLLADPPGLDIGERLVERGNRRGLVIYAWRPDVLEIAVALVGADGTVATVRETLAYWPFTHEELDDDLRAAGLEPAASSYAADVERYLVTARRAADAARGGSPRSSA
jgi:SAM-dependent methyltransferase